MSPGRRLEIIYLLIPLALLLVAAIVLALLWAVKSGQFDDLEGPAHQILMEPEEKCEPVPDRANAKRRSPDEPG